MALTEDGLAEIQRWADMVLSMSMGGIRGLYELACPRGCYAGDKPVYLDLADFDEEGNQECPECRGTVRINRDEIRIDVYDV